MYVCIYVRTYVRMYVRTYVCMYLRMYLHPVMKTPNTSTFEGTLSNGPLRVPLLWFPCSGPVKIGWHYLSNATCLIRPHLFYACLVVSRITTLAWLHYSPCMKKTSVRQVVLVEWLPLRRSPFPSPALARLARQMGGAHEGALGCAVALDLGRPLVYHIRSYHIIL